MPKANTIHTFLKGKLKEKGWKIDDVVERSPFSRSTLYRIFNGYQKPSPEFIAEIAQILQLNAFEQRELQYYSTLTGSDGEKAATREQIFSFLFQPQRESFGPLELIYMDDQKYILTLAEVLERIAELPGFSCRMLLMNCCKAEIIEPFADFIAHLKKEGLEYHAEHFITFSSAHDRDNIVALSHMLPVLCFQQYNVYYRTTEAFDDESLFSDIAFISYQYHDTAGGTVARHLILSFTSNGFSTCFVSERLMMQDFIKRNMDSVRPRYTLLTNNFLCTNNVYKTMLELELKHERFVVKPDISFDSVPMDAYLHMWCSATPEQVNAFMETYMQKEAAAESITTSLDKIMKLIDKRQKASHMHRHVEVVTRAGMEAFVATGKLTNHPAGFPPFDAYERALIVEELIRRDKNKDDPYCLYIINNDLPLIDFVVCVYQGYGVYLEQQRTHAGVEEMPYCFLQHERLGEVFVDFIENYLTNMLAMQKEESYAFLYGLLEKYQIDRIANSE